jgi:hypothetical protein
LLFAGSDAVPAQTDSVAPTGRVLYPHTDPRDPGKVDWAQVIRKRVPVLKHSRAGRWPLTLWEAPPAEALDSDLITAMLERGIAPVLALVPESIPLAWMVQHTGAPVILRDTQGTGSSWPYDLAGHEANWAHRYGAGEQVPEAWRLKPSPTLVSGWALAAQQLRELMREFKRAGVNVNAVWLDYEGEPLGADYAAARASAASRGVLPAWALASATNYRLYTRRLWIQLLSAYIAAPVREVYPAASITNWIATVSLPEMPVLSWDNLPHPPTGSTLLSATNPVAYGIDIAWFHNRVDAKHQYEVDRVYLNILLRQVSADARGRDRLAPELQSLPWVARWVVDEPQRKAPMMSRAAYREALRHLWLRGVDGMQVFNPVRKGFGELAIEEVEDSAAVYDEMLAWREYLDGGAVMNYRYPDSATDKLLWSGLRLGQRALIRAVSVNGKPQILRFEPWPGMAVELAAPVSGATYLLRYNAKENKVITDRQPPG